MFKQTGVQMEYDDEEDDEVEDEDGGTFGRLSDSKKQSLSRYASGKISNGRRRSDQNSNYKSNGILS